MRTRPRVDALWPAGSDSPLGPRSRSVRITQTGAVLMPGAASSCCSRTAGRTPGTSCERPIGSTLVTFIPLFDSAALRAALVCPRPVQKQTENPIKRPWSAMAFATAVDHRNSWPLTRSVVFPLL
jgi:hypothetical protein